MLRVVGQALLHCVVGEVDSSVHPLGCKLFRGGTNVAFLIPVEVEPGAHLYSQHEASDVELASLVEHGVYVLLQNPGLLGSGRWVARHVCHRLLSVAKH